MNARLLLAETLVDKLLSQTDHLTGVREAKFRLPPNHWYEETEDGWVVMAGGICDLGPDKNKDRLVKAAQHRYGRCCGPHTLEDLKKGHGYKCKNGHSFSGSLVV